MADTLKVNKTFTFNIKTELVTSTQFKSTYQGVKLVSMLSASEAIKYTDVYTLHTHAKEVSASNTTSGVSSLPTDANDCTFLLFKNSSDENLILAEEYIDLTTVALSSQSALRLYIPEVEDVDVDTIINFIKSLGYVPTKE